MKGKQNIARLAVLALALSTGVQASAQWNADSTEYDSFDRYRIGGYGELVGAFKNYGINRFKGTSNGNSKMKRNTIAMPRFVIAGEYMFIKLCALCFVFDFVAGGVGTEY